MCLCMAGVEGAVVAGKLLEKSDEENLGGRLGYNAATDKFEDLVAAGVIDPVKVRTSLTASADGCAIGWIRPCYVSPPPP